jgi:hypothetical protein
MAVSEELRNSYRHQKEENRLRAFRAYTEARAANRLNKVRERLNAKKDSEEKS